MEDVQIMETMKEVLKKTYKSKHKKSHKPQPSQENELELSEILSKKWNFSSPPGSVKKETASPLVNAFEMMMKKPEPLSQISPEVNGVKKHVKKRRSYNRKSKSAKHGKVNVDEISEVESDNSFCKVEEILEQDSSIHATRSRKRIRSSDLVQTNGSQKTKKRKSIALLDSNENSVETVLEKEPNEDTYKSGRPKRSCAGKIVNYELLISPEKVEKHENNKTPLRKTAKVKELVEAEPVETVTVDDDEEYAPPKHNKNVKLAPLFVKKASIDPAVKEARRNFLLSGLPEQMRNSIDKQKQFEEDILTNELIAFPSISHITQLHNDEIIDITERSWQESLVAIKPEDEEYESNHRRLLKTGELFDSRQNETFGLNMCDSLSKTEIDGTSNVKIVLKVMKSSFENFPTNRCFKQLYWKLAASRGEEVDSDYQSQVETISADLLFVDIFKPQKLDEFVVNAKPVKELQKFLMTWNEKATDDFDSDDSCSWQSSKANNNFIVLSGSHGSGKTSSVYAIAKELNYQVIEINAGSRRSGKKMLQDLLEATQSHRVKDKSKKLLSTQDEVENSQDSNCEVSHGAKSIILIEDAELVFEADDGFAASLQQLVNISKRPVILTTNNRSCQHLQRFIRHSEILYEAPRNTEKIGKYLSVLCLAANCQIDAKQLERLYDLNGHDLRKTINEIEFFIRSGNSATSYSMNFNKRPQPECSQPNNSNKSLSAISFHSSMVSSFSTMADQRANDSEASYQQRSLMAEMAEYFTEQCSVAKTRRDWAHGKRKIESSISSDLISQSGNLSAERVLATDYSPMLRAICRSEKSRCESGRRTTNNRGHYLRFLITNNSFGNDYFNEQCEMFQQ